MKREALYTVLGMAALVLLWGAVFLLLVTSPQPTEVQWPWWWWWLP